MENLIFDLKSMDLFDNVNDADLKKICEKIVNEASVDEKYSRLKLSALQNVMEKEEKEKQNIHKLIKIENKDQGLLNLYEKAIKDKIHPYDIFKKNGYIKNPVEEFLNAK